MWRAAGRSFDCTWEAKKRVAVVRGVEKRVAPTLTSRRWGTRIVATHPLVQCLDHAATEEELGALDKSAVGGDGLAGGLEDDTEFSGLFKVEHEFGGAG